VAKAAKQAPLRGQPVHQNYKGTLPHYKEHFGH
jgi:hypothetical protein